MLTLSLDLPFLCELQENKITRNLFSQIQSEMSVRPARKKTLNKAAMICCFLSSLKRNFWNYYWLIQKTHSPIGYFSHMTTMRYIIGLHKYYAAIYWLQQIKAWTLPSYWFAFVQPVVKTFLILSSSTGWHCCLNIVTSWNLTKLPSCWTLLWFRV